MTNRNTREYSTLYHDNALLAGQVTEARALAIQLYNALQEICADLGVAEIPPELEYQSLPDWLTDDDTCPDWNAWPDDDA
jgi:hypothetical protein